MNLDNPGKSLLLTTILLLAFLITISFSAAMMINGGAPGPGNGDTVDDTGSYDEPDDLFDTGDDGSSNG